MFAGIFWSSGVFAALKLREVVPQIGSLAVVFDAQDLDGRAEQTGLEVEANNGAVRFMPRLAPHNVLYDTPMAEDVKGSFAHLSRRMTPTGYGRCRGARRAPKGGYQ